MKESLNLELKRQFTKDIIKTVIAFANTSGGEIYIGIDDSGEVIGIENHDDEMLKFTNSIKHFNVASTSTIESLAQINYSITKILCN